jgi:hypothetical protein
LVLCNEDFVGNFKNYREHKCGDLEAVLLEIPVFLDGHVTSFLAMTHSSSPSSRVAARRCGDPEAVLLEIPVFLDGHATSLLTMTHSSSRHHESPLGDVVIQRLFW